MITVKRFLTISLVAIWVVSTIFSSEASAFEFPFGGGENFKYTIHYKFGFSADIAELTLSSSSGTYEGGEGLHVETHIRTLGPGDKLYRIRDLYEADFLLNDNLQPVSYHRDVQEGGYWAKNFYNWNSDASEVRRKITKSTGKNRDESLSNEECLRDIVNVIFCLRSIDFDRLLKGEKVKYPMILDRQINDVTIRMICREQKKVSDEAGTFNAIKLGISDVIRKDSAYEQTARAAAIDSEEETIFFWVTDDRNRLPLFFSAPIALGSMNGRLTSWSGLKYPLEGKVR